LVAGIVWLGLFPGPVLRRMEPASQRFVEAAQPGVAANTTSADRLVRRGAAR
jgi:hypothetical protein